VAVPLQEGKVCVMRGKNASIPVVCRASIISPRTANNQMLHLKSLIFNDVAVGFGMLHSMLHFKLLMLNDVAVVAL
jgi:hypothetical protein